MTEGEPKQLSKNELKKLAKKADKEAKKKQSKGGENASAATAPNTGTTNGDNKTSSPTVVTVPKENVYYLANVTNVDCPSALKAAIAASAFGITLCRSSAQDLPSLFTGPALYINSNTSNVAFGGNGIAKAISYLTSQGGCNLTEVDEWLEVERTSLRKSSSAEQKEAAMAMLENALSSSSGNFVVGNSLTVADIAIVVTLSQQSGHSPVIQSYLDSHLSSDAFINGQNSLSKLVPPPPFDIQNNPSMIQAVNSIFYDAIAKLLPQLAHTLGNDNDGGLVIEKSKQLKFGDYQCKEAMPLFSSLKASNSLPNGVHSPQQLAQAIVDQIPKDNPVCENININGPGFILCQVKASYLEHHINKLMNSAEGNADPKMPLPLNIQEKGQTVVVDFSSPNIAKEMHVGHLRSTIIGESVCRILELVGADVKRVNHVGDWGTQFGMLITYLKEAYPSFASGESSDVAIGDLTQFYKQAKVRRIVNTFISLFM